MRNTFKIIFILINYFVFTKVMVWKTNFDKVDYEEGNFFKKIYNLTF